MKLPKVEPTELAKLIQRRAAEIASDEGDRVMIPLPQIIRLREPTGIFGIHWALADYQSAEGLGYVRVAAAELSAQWDIHERDRPET
jgi:hypothetical protein